MASSSYPSPRPEHLSSLIRSEMKVSAFAWIIRALIISLLKTNICYFWLASHWIGLVEQKNLPNWISLTPIIK